MVDPATSLACSVLGTLFCLFFVVFFGLVIAFTILNLNLFSKSTLINTQTIKEKEYLSFLTQIITVAKGGGLHPN